MVAAAATLLIALAGTTSVPAQEVEVQARVVALVQEGRASRDTGAYETAIARFNAALALLGTEGPANGRNTAFLLNERAIAARMSGDAALAFGSAEEAVALAAVADVPGRDLAVYLATLAQAALDLGRLDVAEETFRRAAALPEIPLEIVAEALIGVAETLRRSGRLEDALHALDAARKAETEGSIAQRIDRIAVQVHLARREVRAARTVVDRLLARADSSDHVLDARVRIQEGDFTRAEEILESVAEDAGASREARASAQYNLAEIEFMRGRYGEAAILNDRAELQFIEVYGETSALVAQTRHRRALVAQQVGDLEDANQEYERALVTFAGAVGATHHLARFTRMEQSRLLSRLGQHEEAVAAAQAVLTEMDSNTSGYERLLATAALGLALFDSGDWNAAYGPLSEVRRLRSLDAFPEIDEPPGLQALAQISLSRGETDAALDFVRRAVRIQGAAGLDSVDALGESRRIEAEVLSAAGQPDLALAIARENSQRLIERMVELSRVPSYTAQFAPAALRRQVGQHLFMVWDRYVSEDNPELGEEMFRTGQILHLNETTQSTNGFLGRNLSNERDSAELYGQRLAAWRDLRAIASLSTSPETLAVSEQLRLRINSLDARIEAAAPGLVARLAPATTSASSVGRLLEAKEALWMQATIEDATFLFLITRGGVRVERSPLNAEELSELVARLRASTDVTQGSLPAFDEAASVSLFEGLFGPFDDVLDGFERLILVPDLDGQQMSPALLARHRADLPTYFGAGHESLRYLGLTHALVVVPSPQAFVRLRQQSASRTDPLGVFLGFGDPTLEGGNQSNGEGAARSAIDLRTGLAQPDILARIFEPLPETVMELQSMAKTANESRLFFGREASEAIVRSTDLSKAGTIAFATHAVVSGDFDHLSEPALILTPPAKASQEDDGLLTASEISTLRLTAEIVVLSACNTASTSGRRGAPGLSGLASGFFEAGARSLIVSHWTILSLSSILIMPETYALFAAAPDDGVSEALRKAMLVTANNPMEEYLSHPAVWAPFTVVGAF